jgi:hypothetical protein
MASLECILEGLKQTEVRGWYMGTIGRIREDSFYPVVVIAFVVC